MPIYELYCPDCHVLFNFYSRRVNTTCRPKCPRCKKKKLQRQVSAFSSPSGAGNDADPGDLPVDEGKMERAIESLAGEAESIDENDPRDAARLMRKFTHMTGMEMNEGMQEAIARMEAGEDPESVEADLGDAMDDTDPFILPGGKGAAGRGRQRGEPARDETLYEM